MTANQQAFTGFAGLPDVNSEWNRMQFAVRSIMSQMATTTLVLVKAVRELDGGYVVDCQPMVAQVDGAGNAVPHGTIHNMPVWRVTGGTSALIVKPVAGDIGLAVFASTDISGVKRAKGPTTPGSARRFDWADGIYLGGLYGQPTQTIVMDETGITITAADGQPVNIIASGGVKVTGDMAVSGAITGGPGATFGGKAFDTHKHSGVAAGTATSGPPA